MPSVSPPVAGHDFSASTLTAQEQVDATALDGELDTLRAWASAFTDAMGELVNDANGLQNEVVFLENLHPEVQALLPVSDPSILPAFPDGQHVVYVGAHGDDSKDGATWYKAKATLAAAIDVVEADPGTAYVIVCLDAGAYTLDETLPVNAQLFAPFADVTGTGSAQAVTWGELEEIADGLALAFTGGALTLDGTWTGDRTITWQDADGTVALLEEEQDWAAVQTFAGGLQTDDILEASAGAGVLIDRVKLKDGTVEVDDGTIVLSAISPALVMSSGVAGLCELIFGDDGSTVPYLARIEAMADSIYFRRGSNNTAMGWVVDGTWTLNELTLSTDLALAHGGTGASTASAARGNLGLGTGDSPAFAGLFHTDTQTFDYHGTDPFTGVVLQADGFDGSGLLAWPIISLDGVTDGGAGTIKIGSALTNHVMLSADTSWQLQVDNADVLAGNATAITASKSISALAGLSVAGNLTLAGGVDLIGGGAAVNLVIHQATQSAGVQTIFGTTAGTDAKLTGYGSSHPSLANNIFYDASEHNFRNVSGTAFATIDSNGLSVLADQDATTLLGRLRIDSRSADVAYLSHHDQPGAVAYILAATASGSCFLNAKTGEYIRLANNGIAQCNVKNGSVELAGGVVLVGGASSAGFNIKHSFQNGVLRITGGATNGTDTSVNLFGSTHASNAGLISYNATTHSFLDPAGTTIYATIDSDGLASNAEVAALGQGSWSTEAGLFMEYSSGGGWSRLLSYDYDSSAEIALYLRGDSIQLQTNGIPRITISDGGMSLQDGKDFALGTTTGTQFGTTTSQKLGFFGATPVVQRPKASYNNWAALSDVVDALVDLGLFDAA